MTAGDSKVARAWLRNENRALGGRPIDQIQTISGLTHDLAYLDSRRAPL
ncbi:MbcA/ParS/Xre antitoxin family protein [Chromatocurvus halotolerans]